MQEFSLGISTIWRPECELLDWACWNSTTAAQVINCFFHRLSKLRNLFFAHCQTIGISRQFFISTRKLWSLLKGFFFTYHELRSLVLLWETPHKKPIKLIPPVDQKILKEQCMLGILNKRKKNTPPSTNPYSQLSSQTASCVPPLLQLSIAYMIVPASDETKKLWVYNTKY